ncbi:MAG: hypothetical protein IT165_32380 [Bryobacterales bacterium]|nr:hypothetical protein [Bryobacterales bacterium]
MPSDRDRLSYDGRQKYRSVVAQQGRVTVPADFNEAQEIAGEESREELLDIVGRVGTPDNGYEISFSNPSPSFDFQVGKGTMYVGGLRVEAGANFTYLKQSDFLDVTFTGTPAREYVFLELEEREISAVEDPFLREVALGGPDTTQRTRLLQRVRRAATNGETCAEALKAQIAVWAAQGWTFDPATMQLISAARLKVGFDTSGPPPGPCEPAASGGYLGAENQLIRVRISGAGKFVWGFDNASFLYRVDVVDSQTVKLPAPPVDPFHYPRVGQAVELLRSEAKLANGEYVANGQGTVVTLVEAYNPDAQTLTLPAGAIAAAQAAGPTPRLFLRVWEAEEDYVSGTAVKLGDTGLTVTITSPAGMHTGDFWVFAARPSTPVELYQNRYTQAPQPPEGPRIWVCPLAVIEWTRNVGEVLEDCRRPFLPLTDLVHRGIRVIRVTTPSANAPGGVDLENDTLIPAERFLGGIDVECDQPVAPGTAKRPTCFATIELPLTGATTGSALYQELTLAAVVQTNGRVIQWRPSAAAAAFLRQLAELPSQEQGYLVRLVLKGNYIWKDKFADVFLDGETFGVRRGGAANTSLRLPSGDLRRGGDFLLWFFMAAPVRLPLQLVASAQPLTIRAEGLTEVVGDIVIQATGGQPTAAGQAVTLVNISVALTTTVTSARFNTEPSPLVDAVLLIDDPTTLNPAKLTDPAVPVPGNGVGLDFAGGGAPNIILGRRQGANIVVFLGVPLDAPGTNAQRVFRIRNIRVRPQGSIAAGGQVMASVSIQNLPAGTGLNNPTVNVAFVQNASNETVRRADGNAGVFTYQANQGVNVPFFRSPANAPDTNVNLQFQELFASAFRVKGAGTTQPGAVVTEQESVYTPGVGGFQVGVATNGTQFRAQFSGLPQGVRLFVTTRDVPPGGVSPTDPNSPKMNAVLLTSEAGGPATPPPPAGVPPGIGKTKDTNVPIAEVPVVSGTGVAVWEWVSTAAGGTNVQSVVFGVVIAAAPAQLPGPATARVNLGLAPASTVADSAPFGTPVPRFADAGTSADLFTITVNIPG